MTAQAVFDVVSTAASLTPQGRALGLGRLLIGAGVTVGISWLLGRGEGRLAQIWAAINARIRNGAMGSMPFPPTPPPGSELNFVRMSVPGYGVTTYLATAQWEAGQIISGAFSGSTTPKFIAWSGGGNTIAFAGGQISGGLGGAGFRRKSTGQLSQQFSFTGTSSEGSPYTFPSITYQFTNEGPGFTSEWAGYPFYDPDAPDPSAPVLDPPFPLKEDPEDPAPWIVPFPLPLPFPVVVPGGDPAPNPSQTPGPGTSPTPTSPGIEAPPGVSPLPIPIPGITPTQPSPVTPTNPDGSLVPPPIPGPVTTPIGQEQTPDGPVGGPGTSPPPTLEGIAQEVGRIEQKVLRLLNRPNPQGDLTDMLQLLLQLLDLLGNVHQGGEYLLSGPCDFDEAGEPMPPREASWPAGFGQMALLSKKIDALAQLIQHHKELRQPTCKRGPVGGQPVTVLFEEV